MVITARQIYCLGQSKLLSLPLALAPEVFNLSPLLCRFSCLASGDGNTKFVCLFVWMEGAIIMIIDTLEMVT